LISGMIWRKSKYAGRIPDRARLQRRLPIRKYLVKNWAPPQPG
jgi:hypothetical protein